MNRFWHKNSERERVYETPKQEQGVKCYFYNVDLNEYLYIEADNNHVLKLWEDGVWKRSSKVKVFACMNETLQKATDLGFSENF